MRAEKPDFDQLKTRSVRMVAYLVGRRPAGVQKSSSHSRGLRPSCRQSSSWVRKATCENFKTECKPQLWSQQITWSHRSPQQLQAQVRHLGFTSILLAQVRSPSSMLAQESRRLITSTLVAQVPLRRTSSRLAQVFIIHMLLAQVPTSLTLVTTARRRPAGTAQVPTAFTLVTTARRRPAGTVTQITAP